MAFAQTAARRPIVGAVATLGVSDRVAFLRKTYGLLGMSLVAFAVLTGGLMVYATDFSWAFSRWALFSGFLGWMLVVGMVVAATMWAQRLAMSESSRGVQYLGLGLAVLVQSMLMQPILWLLLMQFGDHVVVSSYALGTGSRNYTMHMNAHTTALVMQAVVITLAIFVGLTLTVFTTRKDFSFLRGALFAGTFALIGVAAASWIFGFSVGALFCGAGVLLMGGYILYQTSLVMSQFPPTAHVAAATMLFTTIATLFRLVLQILMIFSDRR
jgi:FtsH-binding integral membrane protein